MGKNIKISPSDVKKLAEECKNLAESLSFENPIISEERITKKVKIAPMEESMRNRNLFEYSIPSDDERDNLTESAKEADIYKQIVHDLEAELGKVQEIDLLEEGVLDVLRRYAGKGLLTVAILVQLLSAGKVNAQQLSDAGVEPEKIEVAMDKVDQDRQGRPQAFNFANVKALVTPVMVGQDEFNELRTFTFVTYQGSKQFSYINVPYKLTTSENMAKASNALHVSGTLNYSRYKDSSVSDTTQASRNDYFIIANENDSKITYTVSDYPMEVAGQDTTLKFLGIQVWEGQARNKTPFYNTSRGVAAAQTKGKKTYFVPGEGKSTMSIKGNSVSINLIYGLGIETPTDDSTGTVVPKALELKSSELFKYNSTEVNTNSADYKNMLEQAYKQITNDSITDKYSFVLNMQGSSSQVPTNYPTMSGPKTIDANKQLAQDRARSLGMQLWKDLKAKGADMSNVKKGKVTGVIGDTEYQNDPTNVSRYAPDQWAKMILTPVKK